MSAAAIYNYGVLVDAVACTAPLDGAAREAEAAAVRALAQKGLSEAYWRAALPLPPSGLVATAVQLTYNDDGSVNVAIRRCQIHKKEAA